RVKDRRQPGDFVSRRLASRSPTSRQLLRRPGQVDQGTGELAAGPPGDDEAEGEDRRSDKEGVPKERGRRGEHQGFGELDQNDPGYAVNSPSGADHRAALRPGSGVVQNAGVARDGHRRRGHGVVEITPDVVSDIPEEEPGIGADELAQL